MEPEELLIAEAELIVALEDFLACIDRVRHIAEEG